MARYDAGSGLAGAASGAYYGSTFGPVGTGVGAVVGGIAGLFGSKKKKPRKPKKVSTLDPQQQQLYQEYVSSLHGEGPFSDLYNYDAEAGNKNFDQNVSRPAYRNFSENVIPGITGQYRQGNLMNSSYSAGALGKAGRDVQESLDAQRSDYNYRGQQQANMNRQNAINQILGMQTFNYSKPQEREPSTMDKILAQTGPEVSKWANDSVRAAVDKYGPKFT